MRTISKDNTPFYKYDSINNTLLYDRDLYYNYDIDKFIELIKHTLSKDSFNFPIFANNTNVILKFRLTTDNKKVRGVSSGGISCKVKKLHSSFTLSLDCFNIYKHVYKNQFILDGVDIPASINIYIDILPDKIIKTFVHRDGKILTTSFDLNNELISKL